ncbi:putative development-specific protein LVN1.2 [Apostichopus japonicus]|uniref:Putative development-specific protein LVN1.2 n=1 Tax=Stichopus japonicus TaxID=307972 RepID=A0A2G8L663_STIJA|nr:putative development-specific protein LVN1.2 [Apostichopus japonicus]
MISQSMKCFLTIVVLYMGQAAYATKATPDRCCIQAEQFQTSFGVLKTSYDQYEEVLLTCAFDFKSNQFGCDVDYDSYRIKTYLLVDKDVEYIVSEDSTCLVLSADPAPLRCVPDTLNYVTSFALGNQALLVDTWTFNSYDGNVAYVTTGRKDCTPVSMATITREEGYQEGFSTSYGTAMNFTDSVSDPDYWFVPPASCSNATQQVPKPFLKRLNVLKRLRAATFFL